MREKEEALVQLKLIKEKLVDSNMFIPYDYRFLMVWGGIIAILFLFSDWFFMQSLLSGIAFIFTFILLGFSGEWLIIRKENKKYELERFTKKQQSIEIIYGAISLFSMAVTIVLVEHHLLYLAYSIWIFLLGLGNFTTGESLNISSFSLHGKLTMLLGVMILLLSFSFENITLLTYLAKLAGALFIGGGFFWLGWTLSQKVNRV